MEKNSIKRKLKIFCEKHPNFKIYKVLQTKDFEEKSAYYCPECIFQNPQEVMRQKNNFINLDNYLEKKLNISLLDDSELRGFFSCIKKRVEEDVAKIISEITQYFIQEQKKLIESIEEMEKENLDKFSKNLIPAKRNHFEGLESLIESINSCQWIEKWTNKKKLLANFQSQGNFPFLFKNFDSFVEVKVLLNQNSVLSRKLELKNYIQGSERPELTYQNESDHNSSEPMLIKKTRNISVI